MKFRSDNKVNQSNQNQPIQEKKTLTTDILPEEIPFPVSSARLFIKKLKKPIEEQEPEITKKSGFVFEEEIAPPVKKETSEFIENFKAKLLRIFRLICRLLHRKNSNTLKINGSMKRMKKNCLFRAMS